MPEDPILIIDTPAPFVRRLTLNRPAKRNALSNTLRGELFAALEAADGDPDARVIILRGAGSCFSSGYDLAGLGELPFHTAGGQGQWARHVVEGCFRIWDLAKPVIAQVHGWCLAGGSELAFACDLVYVAEDARGSEGGAGRARRHVRRLWDGRQGRRLRRGRRRRSRLMAIASWPPA